VLQRQSRRLEATQPGFEGVNVPILLGDPIIETPLEHRDALLDACGQLLVAHASSLQLTGG